MKSLCTQYYLVSITEKRPWGINKMGTILSSVSTKGNISLYNEVTYSLLHNAKGCL